MPLITPPVSQITGEPSWRWRRIIIYATVIFCAVMLIWLVDATDTELNALIAAGMLWLMGVLVLVYTGFATVQDVAAIVTMRNARPYAMPSPEPTPAPLNPDTVIIQQQADPTIPPPGYGQ